MCINFLSSACTARGFLPRLGVHQLAANCKRKNCCFQGHQEEVASSFFFLVTSTREKKPALPDLMLQEAHVAVEQGVGRREDPHWLHPGAPLRRALHRHVGEAGQAKVGALAEVAAERRERETQKTWVTESERGAARWLVLPFFWFVVCFGWATLSLQSGGRRRGAASKYSEASWR